MSRTGLPTLFRMIVLTLLVSGCATTLSPPSPSPAVAVNDPLRLGNPKASFAVQLHVDHESLRIGHSPHLDLQATAHGYMNLYFINSSGKTGQLLTNYPVRANEGVTFPPTASKKLQYQLTPPAGMETFILVVTHQPLNLLSRRDISNIKKPRTAIAEFNLTGPQLMNRLRNALRRWPPPAWNANSVQLPLLDPGVHS